MNPMFAAAIGAIIRWALTFLAGYLVTRGIWSQQEATVYVLAAATALTALLWSLYQKYIERAKLVTALATPGVKSEAQIEAMVKDESQRPPVSMDKERLPYPVGTTQRQSQPTSSKLDQ